MNIDSYFTKGSYCARLIVQRVDRVDDRLVVLFMSCLWPGLGVGSTHCSRSFVRKAAILWIRLGLWASVMMLWVWYKQSTVLRALDKRSGWHYKHASFYTRIKVHRSLHSRAALGTPVHLLRVYLEGSRCLEPIGCTHNCLLPFHRWNT